MDPSTCTIILLKQTNPFYIPDNDFNEDQQDTTKTLLETVFGHVHKESNLESCLNYMKLLPSFSTLLLIELDETIPTHAQVEMIMETIDKMTDPVPVIVCSTKDDPNFMIECIQAGAADYLLQPLRPDVIKTLFLTLHRQHLKLSGSTLYQDHLISTSTISTMNSSVISPITPNTIHHTETKQQQRSSAYLPDRIGDRIKALNDKDLNFTKVILETYVSPIHSHCHHSHQQQQYCDRSSTTDSIKKLTSDHKKQLEKRVSVWDFSPLNLSHDDLIHCAVIILSQVFSLSEVTEFTSEQLYNFVIDLSTSYHDENPYHNFAHAIDVLQCIYFFLCQMGLLPFADGSPFLGCPKPYRILRPRDIFALLIAAIGHDTAHPGVNNAFLINTSAPLALLYNDNSVLESFHAMTLFQLLKKNKFDQVLGGTHSVEYSEFRKLVITSILATDMALHGDYVAKINEQKQRLEESNPYEWDEARCLQERLLFCSGLIKCADISNVARPFPRAFEWAQILIEEFASQGDLERELGMNVLPMNDRSKIVLEDSQIGFIKFVALGLFSSVADYMKELSFPVDHIKSNLSIWEDRKRENIQHIPSTAEERQSTTTTVIGKIESSTSSSSTTSSSSSSENDDSTTTNTTQGEEEEEDGDEDYRLHHTQAVNLLNKDSTEGYKLPKMPAAVAMTSLSTSDMYNNSSTISTTTKDDTYLREYDHGWDPARETSSGPVYCQCIIQ